MEYQVVCGNIGIMYCTTRRDAEEMFAGFAANSRTGVGREAFEDVAIMRGGEILKEFSPRWWTVTLQGFNDLPREKRLPTLADVEAYLYGALTEGMSATVARKGAGYPEWLYSLGPKGGLVRTRC